MLYIFGGLPAVGKSSLARHLARDSGSLYLRIDTIEEAIQETGTFGGVEGYEVAYRLAADNVANGLSVVADSVNPLGLTRQAWRDVARKANVDYLEVEIICSDTNEHRARLESRSAGMEQGRRLTWEDVCNREYEVWNADVVFDTAGKSLKENYKEFEKVILGHKR